MATPARLLTLPLKVRLIYYHLFAGVVLHLCYQPRLRSKSAHKPDLETTAILATCRLCHLEALPVFFKTCAFKLMEINDKHAFLRNVPASQYASIQYLILDACNALFDWTPKFIARAFPSLKRIEVPDFHIPGGHKELRNITVGASNSPETFAAIVQQELARFAEIRVGGGRQHRDGCVGILRHVSEERRSYNIVLKTTIEEGSFSYKTYADRYYDYDCHTQIVSKRIHWPSALLNDSSAAIMISTQDYGLGRKGAST